MANMEREPILSARDVEISFSLRGKKLNAIRRCSLDLYQGETLAIVGESGSGKSVFTKSFLGMLDANGSITGGSILFEGKDLAKYKTEKDWMTIRGKKISMVMQDPMTSLNPLKKIGRQIEESIELNQGIKGPEAKKILTGNICGKGPEMIQQVLLLFVPEVKYLNWLSQSIFILPGGFCGCLGNGQSIQVWASNIGIYIKSTVSP